MLLDDDLLRWDGAAWQPTVDLTRAAVPRASRPSSRPGSTA